MKTKFYQPIICGKQLRVYNAYMVSYTVGACSYKNGYSTPPCSVFPVKLSPQVGLRTITVTFDFEGENNHEIAKHISAMSRDLRTDARIFLPDGFWYWCAYDKESNPVVKAPWLHQVTFTLHGVRHGDLQTVWITEQAPIYVDGDAETPAIISLTPKTGETVMTFCGKTITSSKPVTIDGIHKTVLDEDGSNVFGSTDLTRWPTLQPGENPITFSGAARVLVSYYPVFY